MPHHVRCCAICKQVILLTGQSLSLGYLASYYTIDEPTPQETSNTYLLATGIVQYSQSVHTQSTHTHQSMYIANTVSYFSECVCFY